MKNPRKTWDDWWDYDHPLWLIHLTVTMIAAEVGICVILGIIIYNL